MDQMDRAVLARTRELIREFEAQLKAVKKGSRNLPPGHEFQTFQCWVCEKLAFIELLIATELNKPAGASNKAGPAGSK